MTSGWYTSTQAREHPTHQRQVEVQRFRNVQEHVITTNGSYDGHPRVHGTEAVRSIPFRSDRHPYGHMADGRTRLQDSHRKLALPGSRCRGPGNRRMHHGSGLRHASREVQGGHLQGAFDGQGGPLQVGSRVRRCSGGHRLRVPERLSQIPSV